MKHPSMRSLFFAPGNRPDLLAKFQRFSADCYVIDLEDGTPPDDKVQARNALTESVGSLRELGLRGLLTVRVNKPESPHFEMDLQAALAVDVDGIVIPKLENPDTVLAVARLMDANPGSRPRVVIGGIESLRGVINAVQLCRASPRLQAVYFGAEDYSAEIGGRRTARGDEVYYARSHVVLAAKAASILAIDQAVVDIRDEDLFREDAGRGRDLGYDGKICVAPRQADWAHAVFTPTQAERDHASRLVMAYEDAVARGFGTIEFEGRMIDPPLLQRAQRVLAQAEEKP